MKISFVMHPCPALVDDCGVPFGPIRTNFFPQPQVTLASTLDPSGYDLELLDLRTIDNPQLWLQHLHQPYAPPIAYGDTLLSRHLIGDLEQRIASSPTDVDVYVLSANFTYEANAVAETMRLLHAHAPRARVIVGGSDASPPERHQFYFDAGADYIGLGDADASFPHFVEACARGEEQKTYGDRIIAEGGRIHTIDLGLIHRLHPAPSRFSESGGGHVLESIKRKGFGAYIEMQRGCNRTCDFCSAAATPFDRLSVDAVCRQIDNYLENGVGLFMFTDDNMMLRRSAELIEVFSYLREKGAAWEFPNGLEFGLFGTRDPDGVWQPRTELIDALFWNNRDRNDHQGAHRVLMPVEDSLLRRSALLKLKGGSSEEALGHMLGREIPYVNMGMMIGAVGESVEEHVNLRRNLAFFARMTEGTNSAVNFSIFCTMPLPGTAFGRAMHCAGRVRYDITREPELWNVFVSVVEGGHFAPEQITRIRRELLAEYGMDQRLGKVAVADFA